MFSSVILSTIKAYLEALPILEFTGQDPWKCQITADEKPFPLSGQSTITMYPLRMIQKNLKDQVSKFTYEVELCFTKRIKEAPYDKNEDPLYSREITSLVSLTEILGLVLDNNPSLTNNLSNNIISKKDTVVNLLESTTSSSSLTVAAAIDRVQFLGVVRVVEFIIRPIERADSFFTAYNTKKLVERPLLNDQINPAGYSTKLRLQSPEIILPIQC